MEGYEGFAVVHSKLKFQITQILFRSLIASSMAMSLSQLTVLQHTPQLAQSPLRKRPCSPHSLSKLHARVAQCL